MLEVLGTTTADMSSAEWIGFEKLKEAFIGSVIEKIELVGYGDDCQVSCVYFFTDKGVFQFYHDQNCCETVDMHHLFGCTDRCVGAKVADIEEFVFGSSYDVDYSDESQTSSIYKIHFVDENAKGYYNKEFDLVMHWIGESNGYYSETVDFRFAERKN